MLTKHISLAVCDTLVAIALARTHNYSITKT